MLKNENINLEIRQKLEKIYSDDIDCNFDQKVRRWTSEGFKVSLFGLSLDIKRKNSGDKNIASWIDRVDALERIILNNIDNSNYFVLFDELDEDYTNFFLDEPSNDYYSLLTSLFKAIQDVKSIMRSNNVNIFPVLFLRIDIFRRLKDPDKTKWNDLSIELSWNRDLLQKMLAFRLSRALSINGPIRPFDEVWLKVFRPDFIQFRYGQNEISIFDFMVRNSHYRPRDFIRYIRDCAEAAIEMDFKVIDSVLVRRLETKFSSYLKSELVDEMSSILPEIDHIFNVLSGLGKENFNSNDFALTYNKYCTARNIACVDHKTVLEILFNSSAIGNINRSGKKAFLHVDKEAHCSFESPFCIHRGLYMALQIL